MPLLLNNISGIAMAVCEIWDYLSSADTRAWSDTASLNNFGEVTKNIDIFAKESIARNQKNQQTTICLATEEDEKAPLFSHYDYVLFLDPIDGSKHIPYHSSCGTFFSLVPLKNINRGVPIVSGYALYGYKLILALAIKDWFLLCEYDAKACNFSISEKEYKMPSSGAVYSINDADINNFPDSDFKFIQQLRQQGYKARYNGVLVADLHRIVVEGGIFLSPRLNSGKTKTKKYFEALAISHIIRVANGQSVYTYESDQNIFQGSIAELFSSVPLIFGSRKEIEGYKRR